VSGFLGRSGPAPNGLLKSPFDPKRLYRKMVSTSASDPEQNKLGSQVSKPLSIVAIWKCAAGLLRCRARGYKKDYAGNIVRNFDGATPLPSIRYLIA
jgi:hypothetical protein